MRAKLRSCKRKINFYLCQKKRKKKEREKVMSKTGKGIPGRRKSKCQDSAIEKTQMCSINRLWVRVTGAY